MRNVKTMLCRCIYLWTLQACSSTLGNRLDELQLACGISRNETTQNNFWILKPESEGNQVDPKELELYRISMEGSTSNDGLSFTSTGCIKALKGSSGDTLIVHRPSTSNPTGARLLLPESEFQDSRPRIIPISLKPYNSKNFDLWSQCGDVPGKAEKDGVYLKVIDRTATINDFQSLIVTLDQQTSPDITQISKNGCFFFNRELGGKIEITDLMNKVYGEFIIPNNRVQNVLYPIYLGPAPTDQENCLKRNIRWKWTGTECKFKSFIDFCISDRNSPELTETFRILAESLSTKDCAMMEKHLRNATDFTLLQRKNLPNIYVLQDFDNFQSLNISLNNIQDITPINQMAKLKEIYVQGNNLNTLSGIPEKAPLEILSLWDNSLSSLKGIEKFTAARELYAHNNQIETIEELGNLAHLKMIYLSDNRIENISTLKNLTEIEELYIAYNKITALEPLKDLKKLKKLTLSFNQITDITPLRNLENIEVLYLWGNKISDLEPLRKMQKLLTVYLSANKISDISVFKSINTLDLFYAPDNLISDITPLSTQHKIRYINLINNPVSDISALKDLENIIELKMSGTTLDALATVSPEKCSIDAKAPVVQAYCKKKTGTP